MRTTSFRPLCCAVWWLTLCSGGCAPDGESRSDVERRLTLRGADGQSIGIVVSAAACDEELYVAEASGAVWRLDVDDDGGGIARLAMSGDAHLQALYAIALDCQTDALYALDPMTRRIVEVDRHTSAYRRQWTLPVEANRFTIPAGRLTLVPGPLIAIAGLTFGPADDTRERSTASYYRGLHLALLLDMASGTWSTGVGAFEESCIAACHDTELTASSNTVVVTQPTTPRVGLYDAQLRLRRVVDVSSPGFLREPAQPEAPLSQQAGTLWARSNSSVRAAWARGDHLHTVHSLTSVDDDWTPGSSLVQWRHFLNVHTADGRPVALDRRLAGYYVGHTRSHVVTVDYGAGGRQRSAPAVDIVLTRLPVE